VTSPEQVLGSRIAVQPLADLEVTLPAGHSGVGSRHIVRDEPLLVFQDCVMHAGGSAERHRHESQDQILLVLAGTLELTIADGEKVTASADEVVRIPAGQPHSVLNSGEGDCRYLVLTYPTRSP